MSGRFFSSVQQTDTFLLFLLICKESGGDVELQDT
jgi:hypothetical protein